MTAVLEVRGLRKVHGDGEAEVVAPQDVDLALGHGEFLAVTEPSGCGKSTLLNLLGGLDRPTAGETTSTASASTTPARGGARGCGAASSASSSSSST